MVEDEFLAVEEGPEDVFEDLAGFLGVLGLGEGGVEFGLFLIGGAAAEGDEVEVVDDFLRGLFVGDEFFNDLALLDALVGGIAIEEVEGLGEVGFHDDLAGADGGAGGAAEGGEEVVGGVAIGDLDGACSEGQAFEFVGRGGDHGDGIQQDLGADAADHAAGEVPRIGGIGGVGAGGKLVGAGGADVADEFLEVVVVGDEFGSEGIEQLGVGRWVGDADVIDGIDDADAIEVGPDDIDDVAGEPFVVRRGEPIGDGDAA